MSFRESVSIAAAMRCLIIPPYGAPGGRSEADRTAGYYRPALRAADDPAEAARKAGAPAPGRRLRLVA